MQDFDYILLLNKRFSGEINIEESTALDAWINQSATNAQLAEQYQTVWASSTEQVKHFSLDMDLEFQHLQTRIRNSEKLPTPMISIGRWALRAAAAIAVLLISVWGYQQLTPTAPATIVAVAQNQAKRQIQLPDGSVVWLRQNAKLEYPKVFGANQRQVRLDGEAYFEVAHLEGKPFRVELPAGGQVEVLGTRFNVRTGAETSVLVRDGKVRFAPARASKKVLLIAGDKAVFNREDSRILLSKAATFNELSWQTGGLEFVGTPLKDVIADIERFYTVEIELRNSALEQCRHTAPLTNQPINEVLQSLALTYHLKISNPTTGRYILSKGICQ